ncbi:MAG TPA: hypothetical protein VKA68_15925 [bacterium]|nr:hypothetical protein [bacterium]
MRLFNGFVALLLFGVMGVLLSCHTDQPVDPGTDLLSGIFEFHTLSDTMPTISRGLSEAQGGQLGGNPIGNFREYTAFSLMKFTDFSLFERDTIDIAEFEEAHVRLPVLTSFRLDDASASIAVYEYLNQWDESSALGEIDLTSIGDVGIDTTVFPAGLDTADNYTFLSVELDTAMVREWATGSGDENNGLLLKGLGDSALVIVSGRGAEYPPLLELTVAGNTYTSPAQMDYGVITGAFAPAPTGSRVLLENATARRFALRWEQVLDTLPATSYIHSVRLVMPVLQESSSAAGNEHSINLARGAGDGIALPENPASITRTVSETDSALVVTSSSSEQFLWNYVQNIVSGEPGNAPLVFYYTNEGVGVQYLTFDASRARLEIVYSDIEG